jgi:ATP-dependent exoDNAse (exonuclease V) alpha subunit
MAIELNKKQKEVFDQLKAFVKNTTHNTFILNGYAGTGKTFLVQEFAKYLKEQKIKYSLLATTGRAAAVLKGKTALQANTVHGELYRFSKIDGDHDNIPADAPATAYGQMKLVFEPKLQDEKDKIYIVDEASMLGSELGPDTSFASFGSGLLLPDLLDAIGNNKIIFVGDPCQLPPISQTLSPALNEPWLVNAGRKIMIGTLDQIMRTQQGNDILTIATDIRNAVGKPKVANWTKLPAKNRKNCSVFATANILFLEYFSRFLQYGSSDCIAIAQSNNTCNKINKSIRSWLYSDTNKIINAGEILMVSQNNYLVPLTNGDFVKVLQIGEIETKELLRFADVRVKHIETGNEYQVKLALDPFFNYSPNLTTEQQRSLMIDFSRRMRVKKIGPKSEAYQESMRKDPWLNSLRANYGYAVTCHKAQGGEWTMYICFWRKVCTDQ